MKSTSTYDKSTPQVKLECILRIVVRRAKKCGLTPSQLLTLSENMRLNQKFKETLVAVINVLVHEADPHELITSLAHSYPSQYYTDVKEHDTLYEIISETYLGLYDTITKPAGDIDNTGRVRIDTFLDNDPAFFVHILRKYILRNILRDIIRKRKVEKKHIESDTVAFREDDENDSFSKLDSVIFNKHNIEDYNDYTEAIIRRASFKPDTCSSLINAVIKRFMSRKPVAGYIYLCIINKTYDAMTIVSNLKKENFNVLFHSLLHELEFNYNINLSRYNDTIFNADKYISSFCQVDDKQARARIDRLASQTRIDVKKIPEFEAAKSNYVDINEKYFSL